jgi:hypothetical protein
MGAVRVENPRITLVKITRYLATAFPHDQDPKQTCAPKHKASQLISLLSG